MRVEQQISSLVRAFRSPWCRSAEVLEDCGLSSIEGRSVKKLSTGVRMRASIAITLIGEPELFVLDELTNGLDVVGIKWVSYRATMRL
jgi:ABC-2 type transport system ATP-binding protein